MVELALKAKRAGATVAAIACNTMHIDKASFEKASGLEMLDMVGGCMQKIRRLCSKNCEASKRSGPLKVGITGTCQTMKTLYKLNEKECISVVPSKELQREIQDIIVDCKRLVLPCKSERFVNALKSFVSEQTGALDYIVLGCTDLPSLLMKDGVCMTEIDGVAIIDPIDSLLELCEPFIDNLSRNKL